MGGAPRKVLVFSSIYACWWSSIFCVDELMCDSKHTCHRSFTRIYIYTQCLCGNFIKKLELFCYNDRNGDQMYEGVIADQTSSYNIINT